MDSQKVAVLFAFKGKGELCPAKLNWFTEVLLNEKIFIIAHIGYYFILVEHQLSWRTWTSDLTIDLNIKPKFERLSLQPYGIQNWASNVRIKEAHVLKSVITYWYWNQ